MAAQIKEQDEPPPTSSDLPSTYSELVSELKALGLNVELKPAEKWRVVGSRDALSSDQQPTSADQGVAVDHRSESVQAMPDEAVDAKIAAAEARTDAKFAELKGDISTQFAELRGDIKALAATTGAVQAATTGLKSTIIATGIGIVLSLAALLVGMLAYGATNFYNGTVMRDAVNAAVVEHSAATEQKK